MIKEDEITKLIEKAEHNITVTANEYKDGNYDIVASRAYYAMFYCAEAILLTKKLVYSKHSAVRSAFGRYFAKTGKIESKLHRILIDAEAQRNRADYDHMVEITKKEAEEVLKDAEYFVDKIKKYLEIK